MADKCLRFHHHFKKMIVLLVNIKTKRFYDEWEDELKKIFSGCFGNHEILTLNINTIT